MRKVIRYLLLGIGVWAIPFAIGMALFPVIPPESALFDTLVSVAMSASAGGLSYLYLRRLARPDLASGLMVGLGWAVIALALDSPMLLNGLFGMSVAEYFADIGLTYLMIPAIAGCIGLALRRTAG